METNYWNIIYTRPKAEMQVADYLKKKGIRVYLPLHNVIVQWSDRKKKMKTPLFPNYVFVKLFSAVEKNMVAETCGFLRFLHTNKQLDILKDEEIETVQKLVEGSLVSTQKNLHAGDSVIVTCGSFKGMTGKLFQEKGTNRFVVHLEGLKQYLSVELSPDNIERFDFVPFHCFLNK